MRPIDLLLGWVSRARGRVERYRTERRWRTLRALGMKLGGDVLLPASTWIDSDYCHLIEIGDHTGFGEECLLLAHDAQMDEFLDAARVGRIVIGASCHIGARTIILAGVEIGARTIVGAGSLVSRSLPADSVCVGSPARVIDTFDNYIARHREALASSPRFPYSTHGSPHDGRASAELVGAVREGPAYITGGRSAELRGEGGSLRTPVAWCRL